MFCLTKDVQKPFQTSSNKQDLSQKGEFYLWVAKDPVKFYSDYVSKNRNITIKLPATLNVADGEKVENDFQQIDFGNPYVSNLCRKCQSQPCNLKSTPWTPKMKLKSLMVKK